MGLFAVGHRGLGAGREGPVDRVELWRALDAVAAVDSPRRYVGCWTRSEWYTFTGWDCEPGRVVEVTLRPTTTRRQRGSAEIPTPESAIL